MNTMILDMAEECSFGSCSKPQWARKLCTTHYRRWHKYGDPAIVNVPVPKRGPLSPAWKGDQVGYTAAHKRVYKLRGKADHCSVCGTTEPGTYFEWANLTGHLEDPYDYAPMCKKCHRKYDADVVVRGSRASWSKLTEDQVIEIFMRASSGERVGLLAREFDVHQGSVSHIIHGQTWSWLTSLIELEEAVC
jgi:hypothetical protein